VGRLISSSISSLDGYVADETGDFDWAAPDDEVSSARTRIEREFDPGAVRALKDASPQDLTIGGPELAAQPFAAGLVDECHLFLCPVVVGGGHRSLPDHMRIRLELLDQRRFGNGTVHLHYGAR
jgi:dihydrofolate reductase